MKPQPYTIHIGDRYSFGVMAESRSRAIEQHIDLAEEGERVQAIPLFDEPLPLKLVRHELQTVQLREVMS